MKHLLTLIDDEENNDDEIFILYENSKQSEDVSDEKNVFSNDFDNVKNEIERVTDE